MRPIRCFGLALLLSCTAPAYGATIFDFPDFSSCAGLQLNGNAACTASVLRVTPSAPNQSGSVFSTALIPLGSGASFSTFFTFRISASQNGGADGFAFVVQPVASTVGGLGGGLGYTGIPTSLAVEFDTWNNGSGLGDPSDNHVGVDLNGSVDSVQTAEVSTSLKDGGIWYAWIDYNGSTLELRLSKSPARPAAPILSYAVDLASVLGTTSAYVGFSSGTGFAYSNHDIQSWRFDNEYAPIDSASGPVVVPALSATGTLLLACLAGLVALLGLRRRRAA